MARIKSQQAHTLLTARVSIEALRVQLNRDAAPTALYDDCGYLLTGLTDEELQTYHEHPRKAFLVLHWMRQELVLLRPHEEREADDGVVLGVGWVGVLGVVTSPTGRCR